MEGPARTSPRVKVPSEVPKGVDELRQLWQGRRCDPKNHQRVRYDQNKHPQGSAPKDKEAKAPRRKAKEGPERKV